MDEEYLVVRLMQIGGIPITFAKGIYKDLEYRGLLQDLKDNINTFENYSDIHYRYYDIEKED